MSPAQLLFGRALADFLPVNPKAYQLHPHWATQVQKSLTSRTLYHSKLAKRYNIGTRNLKPLAKGQTVRIQNCTAKQWDRCIVV